VEASAIRREADVDRRQRIVVKEERPRDESFRNIQPSRLQNRELDFESGRAERARSEDEKANAEEAYVCRCGYTERATARVPDPHWYHPALANVHDSSMLPSATSIYGKKNHLFKLQSSPQACLQQWCCSCCNSNGVSISSISTLFV
jgi:hypothetical protein